MFRDDQGHEAVISLDPKSGETVWKHSYDVTIVEEGPDDVRHVVQFGKGPHATPALKDGYLYTFGFTGILKCIDSSTGKAQWSQDLNALGGSFMRFGCSSSPLIHEDKVIVQIGGKGNGLVAFDRRSGKVRWRATDLDATHSSPIVIDVDGAPLLLSAMSTDVIAVDPSDGQVRWRLAPEGEFQASITTPIWCPNDILFLNLSGDEEGGCALKFSSRGSDIHAERLWFSRKARGSLSNPVRIGNVLYGTAGGRSSIFQAIDVETGKILWRKRGFERCSVVASADGKLVILEEKGKLSIATPTTEGLDVHATVELLTEPAWSAPTLIDDILFVRDSKTIVAVDLGA
jgi:outer membrane protein assembly factor BamB